MYFQGVRTLPRIVEAARNDMLERWVPTLPESWMTGMPHKGRLSLAVRLGLWMILALISANITHAAAKPAQAVTDIAAQTDSPFALADFDGDKQLDIATVQVGQVGASQTRYWIHFRLSSGMKQLIPVTAPIGGLRIASQDVNGDSFVDLVVTTALHQLPVAVLLNDGRGNFTLRDSRTFPTIVASQPALLTSSLGRPGDVAAALLSRSSLSRCETPQRAVSPNHCRGLLLAAVFCNTNHPSVESVLGRAPPVPFLQA